MIIIIIIQKIRLSGAASGLICLYILKKNVEKKQKRLFIILDYFA